MAGFARGARLGPASRGQRGAKSGSSVAGYCALCKHLICSFNSLYLLSTYVDVRSSGVP